MDVSAVLLKQHVLSMDLKTGRLFRPAVVFSSLIWAIYSAPLGLQQLLVLKYKKICSQGKGKLHFKVWQLNSSSSRTNDGLSSWVTAKDLYNWLPSPFRKPFSCKNTDKMITFKRRRLPESLTPRREKAVKYTYSQHRRAQKETTVCCRDK